ncbi:MAG: hypothetical protein FWC35_06580, partial [Proteobacteria bacterium]|nr:hypothetical protein [Pseudomonadota bacterium]
AAARSRYHARLKRLAEAVPVKQRRTEKKVGAVETPDEVRKRAIADALAAARARRSGSTKKSV